MTKESTRESQRRYNKKLRSFILKFNRDKDSDVISKLQDKPNITDYIRNLVRSDVQSEY